MAKNVVKQIRKATRRRFSAEEKIRIVPVSQRVSSLFPCPTETKGDAFVLYAVMPRSASRSSTSRKLRVKR